MTVDLLLDAGHVAGAIGFHIHTGRFFVVEADATMIATGNTNRIYENPRGNPFNTWLSPYNTGDGQVMALAAGGEAALTRMLGLMKQDMRTALGLTGIPDARDVNRAALLED